MAFLILYVTHPDEDTARRISQHLVERKMAACANIFPIQSAYWWQGVVQNESEWVSILKTKPENWETIVAEIEKIHPYEVPCITKISVEANPAYEKWIRESCG
jgi:periplasmic divalent cation tolerance protein